MLAVDSPVSDVAAVYDQLAAGDGAEHSKARYRFASQQRRMADVFEELVRTHAPIGGNLLDIGCGRGVFSAPFAKSYVVTGIDLSADLLVTARGRGIRALQADASAIPIEDHAFDTVLCPEFLQMMSDPAPVVREAARVCRPGGTIILSTLYARSLLRRIYRLRRYVSTEAGRLQKAAILRSEADLRAIIAPEALKIEQMAWTHFPSKVIVRRPAGGCHPLPFLASNIVLVLKRP